MPAISSFHHERPSLKRRLLGEEAAVLALTGQIDKMRLRADHG